MRQSLLLLTVVLLSATSLSVASPRRIMGPADTRCLVRPDSLRAWRGDSANVVRPTGPLIRGHWISVAQPLAQVTYFQTGREVLQAVVLTWADGALVRLTFSPPSPDDADPLRYQRSHSYEPAAGPGAHGRHDLGDRAAPPVPDADRDLALAQLRLALSTCAKP